MRRRGFTLVEVITCIAIICVLTAILLPVVRSVRHQTNIENSLSNLRQFHIALKLYQTEADGDGRYGTPDEMGMPPMAYVTLNRFGTPVSMWGSPCGQNFQWMEKPIVIQYDFYPRSGNPRWLPDEAVKYRENFLTFFDMNCTDEHEPLTNPLLPHRGLGVLLSGQLVNQKRPGSYLHMDWWAKPTEH